MKLKSFQKYLRPLIAILLLVFLFKSGLLKFDQLKTSLANPVIIFSGLGLLFLQFLFFTLRWQKIVDIFHSITYPQALRLNLIGQFFNFFIPSGVGGDIVKALEMSKMAGLPKKKTFTLIALDRAFGLYAMICFSLIFLLLEYSQNPTPEIQKFLYVSALMFVVATTGLTGSKFIHGYLSHIQPEHHADDPKMTFGQKVIASLKTLMEGFQSAFRARTLAWVFGTSFLAQLLSISFIYIVVKQFTVTPPSFLIFFPLACFAFMASAIPVTPGGIGFGQVAFSVIFSVIDKDVANSVVVAVSLMQFFQLIYSLPGAYLFLTSRKKYESQLISET